MSSRLLARAARALLAPGAGPITNTNGKPINFDGTLATTSSSQSASSTTDLRDSPSAVALRSGASNLTDKPSALGGNYQTGPVESEPEVEEEDPFIKDTEDLVNSMQMSSPSWNDGSEGGDATDPVSYADSNQPEVVSDIGVNIMAKAMVTALLVAHM